MNIHKEKIIDIIKKRKVVTTSEVAEFFDISWNTADSYLKDMVIDGEIERIKKEGVTLWMRK